MHVVIAALYQKNVITGHDLQKLEEKAHLNENMLLNLIMDLLRKPLEDVAMAADMLDRFGCKREANVLRCKLD